MTPPVELSVVIPAYNEEQRLPATLRSIQAYFERRGVVGEVLVVSDGSSDRTAEVAREISANIRVLAYKTNRGKGFALRYGVSESRGALVLIDDADGSTPIAEVERLEAAIAKGADIAIGSRALQSGETAVKTVWYRKFIGRTFATLVNILIVPGIADTQCGFKLFKGDVAKNLFQHQRSERFSFDVELLFLARRNGLTITEVPVNWTNAPGSKVNLVKDSLEMFYDIIRFRLMAISGIYQSPVPLTEIRPRD